MTSTGRRRPTREELLAAAGREIPDLLGGKVRLLICGINPGLWSGWSGHHFAGPANRLWPALERAGITPGRITAADRDVLTARGVGITNLVARTSAVAADLTTAELRAGAARLEGLVAAVRPGALAVLGMGAYRTAFREPRAALGRQDRTVGGRPVWVLPNPSGLQQRYGVGEIAALLREAYEAGAAGAPGAGRRPDQPLADETG